MEVKSIEMEPSPVCSKIRLIAENGTRLTKSVVGKTPAIVLLWFSQLCVKAKKKKKAELNTHYIYQIKQFVEQTDKQNYS